VKRILILGVAALVLAVLAPSIGTGASVAQAGTTVTDPTAPVDPNADPNAPDVNTGDESSCGADGAKLGAHASGEDCPVTPPPPVTPAPVTPAPATPAPESKKKDKKSSGDSGVAGKTETRKSAASLPVVQSTTTTVADTDTGTIPQGGIQAGGGGTANDGTALALLLGSGALVLTLMAGGLALRRRGFES
jgi:hypothetical protein